MAEWTFDPILRRYRRDGRLLTEAAMVTLRNGFADARAEVARDLASLLIAGSLTVPQFGTQFEAFIEETILAGFLFGRGGINQATDDDFARVTELVDLQLEFWAGFETAIKGGELSDVAIAARAAQYSGASVLAYETGREAAHGFSLPGYPADSEVLCGASCRCFWEIRESDDKTEWICVWNAVGDSNTCATCSQRARDWAPYVVPK